MSKRPWRRGLVRGVWWLAPTGTGLFVELLLDLRGLMYEPVGVQRFRGPALWVSYRYSVVLCPRPLPPRGVLQQRIYALRVTHRPADSQRSK